MTERIPGLGPNDTFQKFNPHHDARGRFASAGGGGGSAAAGGGGGGGGAAPVTPRGNRVAGLKNFNFATFKGATSKPGGGRAPSKDVDAYLKHLDGHENDVARTLSVSRARPGDTVGGTRESGPGIVLSNKAGVVTVQYLWNKGRTKYTAATAKNVFGHSRPDKKSMAQFDAQDNLDY